MLAFCSFVSLLLVVITLLLRIKSKDMGTDIACFRLGGVHVVPITCPKIAREVLKKQDKNFLSRPLTFASHAISYEYKDAVLAPFGDQWMKMRKRADEADNLRSYIYNLIARGSSSTSGLANVDVRHVARHYYGNGIRRLVFGQRYFGEPQPDGGPGPMEVEHMDASFTLLGLLFSFCVSDYLPCLLGLDLDDHEKIIKEAITKVDRLHNMVIEER
uniref:Tyrosine N-monooxygenase n=1 Tax=Aegilops tauschii TaxID=37682 RepID=N1QV28_AEGTA